MITKYLSPPIPISSIRCQIPICDNITNLFAVVMPVDIDVVINLFTLKRYDVRYAHIVPVFEQPACVGGLTQHVFIAVS